MIIKSLKLNNFWSHKNTEISFDKDFYMILGRVIGKPKSNGSGKSTIARGICYALYGDASDEIKNNEAIHNDEETMSVELVFELNDVVYKITRKVKRNSTPVLRIEINGEEKKPRLKEGQDIINGILGADFEIFRNTSYFKQGDLNSFSNLTPKEAKEVVIKLLQLDAYNEYELRAKEKVSDVTEIINDTKGKLAQLEAMIKQEEDRITERKYTSADAVRLTELIEELKIKQASAKEAIDNKLKVLGEVAKEISKQKSDIRNKEYERDTITKRLDKLLALGKCCPTCERELTGQDITALAQPINTEIEALCACIDKLTKDLQVPLNMEEELKKIEVDDTPYNIEITQNSRTLGEVEAELKQAEKDTAKIEKLKQNLIKGQAKLVEQEAILAKYDKLKVAFGKKGIQAFIVENVIPEIQATTNEILESLETEIRVVIDSQKELKKGGKSETLDIKVLTEFGERPYANYSGGERTFIDFALRVALSIILTRRSECQIQTLILDEVWGQLDGANRAIASRALRFVADKFNFKKILIISHQEELQDCFNNIIQVENNGKESRVIRND